MTETNSAIKIQDYVCISTSSLPENFDGVKYKAGENRTSIWTKYKIIEKYKTFDEYTSVCVDLETPFGSLIIYGTIIGVFANKQPRFDNDLEGNLKDFENIFFKKQVCIAGDLNVMFSGFAYPSHKARQKLNDAFKKHDLSNITAAIKNNVDHIILSNQFIKNKKTFVNSWNLDKELSDHIGHYLLITEN